MSTPSADALEAVENLVADRQWPITVKLKHPVDFGSERIESLTFRRGRMGDLKGLGMEAVPPIDQLLLVASRMCGKPTNVLELLDDEDGSVALELALSFFVRSLPAGRKR